MSSAFINSLMRHGSGVVSKARLVKKWTRETLALCQDEIVSVNQIACSMPGCAPLETIMLVMRRERGALQASIHKALIDVELADVEAAWRSVIRPGSPMW